jgi:hypothetical protein
MNESDDDNDIAAVQALTAALDLQPIFHSNTCEASLCELWA